MNKAIRYYTHSGNTKKVAEAFSQVLGVPAHSVEQNLTQPVDILFLGCSYYAFDIDPHVKTFLKENRDKIGSIVVFGTSAGMKSIRKPVKKVADQLNIPVHPDFFHCFGSFGPTRKGHPDRDDLEKAKTFAHQFH